jgi:hypothetical protein
MLALVRARLSRCCTDRAHESLYAVGKAVRDQRLDVSPGPYHRAESLR